MKEFYSQKTTMIKPKISVIIPTYNEQGVIGNCLESLSRQDYPNFELIVIDDGSLDSSVSQVENQRGKVKSLTLLKQKHFGPGAARNLGVKHAKGEILVFVDADMEFEPDFISKLVAPIIAEKTIGTFSKEEYLLNEGDLIARFWNLNLGREAERMVPKNYPNFSPVFRAIRKSAFETAGGFDPSIGYTDDWTLFRRLQIQATVATGAKFYHRNPISLFEVWRQARWFGKNEFLTGNFVRTGFNLLRYNVISSLIAGAIGAVRFESMAFLIFKVVYDLAVFTSLIGSLFGEQKNK